MSYEQQSLQIRLRFLWLKPQQGGADTWVFEVVIKREEVEEEGALGFIINHPYIFIRYIRISYVGFSMKSFLQISLSIYLVE